MDLPTFDRLVSRWLDGTLNEDESQQLQAELNDSADRRLRFRQFARLDASLRQASESEWPLESMDRHSAAREQSPAVIPASMPSPSWLSYSVMSFAAIAATLVGVWLFTDRPQQRFRSTTGPSADAVVESSAESSVDKTTSSPSTNASKQQAPIATLIGVSGPIRWIGDGGRVKENLKVGEPIFGGTFDGLSPDSLFELRFNDQSTVTVAGSSLVTFSDDGQKRLHLRSGVLSAEVEPQPDGKPMLIYTPTATLTVVGTSFEVLADQTETSLSVREGQVDLTGRRNGKQVQVPASYQVVAAVDREWVYRKVPKQRVRWATELSKGLEQGYGNYGKWLPRKEDIPARVRALPLVPTEVPDLLLYLAGLSVSPVDGSKVRVKEQATFTVDCQLGEPEPVFLGIRVTEADGNFAGQFVARADVDRLTAIGKSDSINRYRIEYQLSDFFIDPSVKSQRESLKSSPKGLILSSVWCFTVSGNANGLELTSVRLEPPSP